MIIYGGRWKSSFSDRMCYTCNMCIATFTPYHTYKIGGDDLRETSASLVYVCSDCCPAESNDEEWLKRVAEGYEVYANSVTEHEYLKEALKHGIKIS